MKKAVFVFLSLICMTMIGGCGGDYSEYIPDEDVDIEWDDADDYDGDDADYTDGYDAEDVSDYTDDYSADDADYTDDYNADYFDDYSDYTAEISGNSSFQKIEEIGEIDEDVTLESFIGTYQSPESNCTVYIKECTNDYHDVNIEWNNGLDEYGLNFITHWNYFPHFDAENARLYADKGSLYYEWYNSDGIIDHGDQMSSSEAVYFYFSDGRLIWVDRKNDSSYGMVFERVD